MADQIPLHPDHAATPRVIVCAAVLIKRTGIIICGPRHGECLNAIIELNLETDPGSDNIVCGFVDQENNFLSREEAWPIADAAGQIRRPTGWERDFSKQRPPGVGDQAPLFSENLY